MSDSTLHIGTLASNNVNNIVNDTSKYDEYKEKVKYNGVKEESSSKFKNNRAIAKISAKKREASRNTKKQLIYKELNNDENE